MKVLLPIVVALSALSCHAQAQPLKIAVEGAYPPFSYFDDKGALAGFDVDIANALCTQMKAECEVLSQEWDGLIPGLNAKQYDAILASMTVTDERRAVVDFTESYYRSPVKFMAAKGAALDFEGGLEGKVIGVQSGTVYEAWLQEAYPKAEIRSYPSTEEHNADLVAGRIDVVITDALSLIGGFLGTAEGADYELTGPELTDPRLVGEGQAIALRKGDDDLRQKLNEAIIAIRADGTYAEINKKYFDIDIFGR